MSKKKDYGHSHACLSAECKYIVWGKSELERTRDGSLQGVCSGKCSECGVSFRRGIMHDAEDS